MWREMIIFADTHTIKQILNSKTEAHSYPLWTVGERANIIHKKNVIGPLLDYPQNTVDKSVPQSLNSVSVCVLDCLSANILIFLHILLCSPLLRNSKKCTVMNPKKLARDPSIHRPQWIRWPQLLNQTLFDCLSVCLSANIRSWHAPPGVTSERRLSGPQKII